MSIVNNNILLISPEPWSHLFVSKHHYAINLAEMGNKVFFLNPPGERYAISPSEYKNLSILDYKGFWKGLYKMPKVLRRLNVQQVYKQLEVLSNSKFDVIWSFDNSVFFDLDLLPTPLLKISHIVDLNQDFQFERSTKTADLCLSCSKAILNKQLKWNEKSFFIHHGYNVGSKIIEYRLPGQNKVKAAYSGNLDSKYLDYELLLELIKSFPLVDFVFAGNYSEKNPLNQTLPNLFLLGRVPSDSLPGIYKESDILLVTYLAKEFENQLANPHKIMEYLGSGKVVIATKTLEYEENPHVEMVCSTQEFVSKFEEVLENLDHYNSLERKKSREAFAIANSYPHQIKRIFSLI